MSKSKHGQLSQSFGRRRFNGHWAACFHDDLYKFDVHIIWPVQQKEFAKYMDRKFGVSQVQEMSFAGRCTEIRDKADDWTGDLLISLCDWHLGPKRLNTLSHEVMHATHIVMKHAGMTLSDSTQEAYCYLHGALMQRCLNLLMNK